MSSHAPIWRAAQALARSGTLGAMATVSRHRGSLPMAEDAKMVVAVGGQRWGTVGGGCTEADVTDQALRAAREGKPTFVQHTLNADLAGDLGLSCGGTVELFLEPIVPAAEMAQLYGVVADAIEQRVPATVYTAIDWGRGPAKMARTPDSVTTVGTSSRATVDSSSATDVPAASFVDEENNRFVEPVARLPRLVIFGAGHVGAQIARLAANVGFYVVISDDRAEFANAEQVPWADETIAEDFRTLLDRLVLDEDDYVLATTRGHAFDAAIIERTAASRARYVGMLGSRRKREVIFKALADAGVPRAALDRVKVPIGEPIGADTPAEIAVSVVAELIRVRRLGTTG